MPGIRKNNPTSGYVEIKGGKLYIDGKLVIPDVPFLGNPQLGHHPNCRCVWITPDNKKSRAETDMDQAGYKLAARLLLTGAKRHNQLVYPTKEEAYGINLLDRDDQLNIRKQQ